MKTSRLITAQRRAAERSKPRLSRRCYYCEQRYPRLARHRCDVWPVKQRLREARRRYAAVEEQTPYQLVILIHRRTIVRLNLTSANKRKFAKRFLEAVAGVTAVVLGEAVPQRPAWSDIVCAAKRHNY